MNDGLQSMGDLFSLSFVVEKLLKDLHIISSAELVESGMLSPADEDTLRYILAIFKLIAENFL